MVILYAEFNKIMLKNGTSDNFNEAKKENSESMPLTVIFIFIGRNYNICF